MSRCTLLLAGLLAVPGCYLSHYPASYDGGADTLDVPRSDAPVGAAVTVACGDSVAIPSSAGVMPCELSTPGDSDRDGFDNALDCNDCIARINPGSLDIAGNGLDEDCDGVDAPMLDDRAAPLDSSSPFDAACAIGLCQRTTPDALTWGVISARWTQASGTGVPPSVRHRITERLGTYRPTAGSRMLAMASGPADDPTAIDSGCGESDVTLEEVFPPGFPVGSPACDGVETGAPHDSVALELEVRVPSNAVGLRFESNFMTREYPDFLCSGFNDVYAVFLDDGRRPRNIVYDRASNPITVNNVLLRTCVDRGPIRCELGEAPLRGALGTPFASCLGTADGVVGGGTDCISTTVEIDPGTIIRLRFAIWDSGDNALDSIVLIDGFQFILGPFDR